MQLVKSLLFSAPPKLLEIEKRKVFTREGLVEKFNQAINSIEYSIAKAKIKVFKAKYVNWAFKNNIRKQVPPRSLVRSVLSIYALISIYYVSKFGIFQAFLPALGYFSAKQIPIDVYNLYTRFKNRNSIIAISENEICILKFKKSILKTRFRDFKVLTALSATQNPDLQFLLGCEIFNNAISKIR